MTDRQEVEKKGAGTLQTEPMRERDEATFIPQVDIIEKKDCVLILADMPGVSRDNVDAMMEEGVLTIDGRITHPEEEGLSLESAEYETGNFHRSFAVGEGLDAGNIEAGMKDGVLRVSIPKSEKYKPKQIEIK